MMKIMFFILTEEIHGKKPPETPGSNIAFLFDCKKKEGTFNAVCGRKTKSLEVAVKTAGSCENF